MFTINSEFSNASRIVNFCDLIDDCRIIPSSDGTINISIDLPCILTTLCSIIPSTSFVKSIVIKSDDITVVVIVFNYQ